MILVTGGAGFIGSNYLLRLCEQGHAGNIVCVDSLTYASNYRYIHPLVENNSIKFEMRDISNKSDMYDLFKKYNPDYVVHFAAESHVDNSIKNYKPFIQTNILGTINLLERSLDLPNLKKFVHVSTDEVYGSLGLDEDRSFTELSHYETNSPYSASKAASDCFVRAFYKTYGLPTVITHCSNNYGPNQNKEKFIPTILNNALSNNKIPVYGTGENVRDWLFVQDHCDGINLALEKGVAGEKYNIGGGEEVSNIAIVRMLLDMLHRPHSLIDFVTDRAGHDLRYSIDCSKIKDQLGYTPKFNLQSGLEKTIRWYQRTHV
jgi:dTDP-glucose 4,6-dehydratase